MRTALVALALFVFLHGCGGDRRAAAPTDRACFRLTFGVKDAEPADWSGSVETAQGRVVALSPWRFDKEDRLLPEGNAWSCSTRLSAELDPQYWWLGAKHTVPSGDEKPKPSLIPNGLYVTVEGAAEVKVKTRQGAFSFRTSDHRYGETAGAMVGRVRIERVPVAHNLTAGDDAQDDYPTLAFDSDSNVWVAWIRYRGEREQLVIKGFPDGPPGVIAEGEFFRPTLIAGPAGKLFLAVSVHVENTWKIAVSAKSGTQWSPLEYITSSGPDLAPKGVVDGKGRLWIVWQGFREGRSQVVGRIQDSGAWRPEFRVSENRANAWDPVIAAGAGGRVHLAWDAYDAGNYDIYYRRFDGESFRPVQPITTSPRFEAHAAVAEDRFGRVWLAWDEAGANWGKDTGFLVKSGAGEGLYEQREIRTVILAESRMLAAPPLVRRLSGGGKEFLEQPQLAADSNGNVWCLVRRRATKMHEVWSQALQRNRLQQYSFWEYGLYRFAGSVASPIPLPFSWGRNDLRAAIAAAPGGRLALAWAADGRSFAKPYPFVKNEVFVSDIPGVPYGEPALQPILERSEPVKPIHPGEDRDVARLRAERISAAGKTYRVLRGDMHRHTDLSFDGDIDGSLWDFYRYSIDAANFDYAALTDHNAGDDNEYLWWLIQKSNDLFFYPERFTPLYAYERSLRFPNGHRNLVWARRGVRTLLRGAGEEAGKEGAQRLYAYLRSSGGLAMSHTSATLMGTDWRDNDPALEPLVEVYQGDRTSYEHEGAPRAATAADKLSQPGGFQPQGFVWNAWAKGYKLGVQASSDHASTHISYAVLLAENLSREALLDAIRARRSYAATDNILVDFRCDGHLQGEAFSQTSKPRFDIRVEGTAIIAQIDVIKSNRYVFQIKPGKPSVTLAYQDNEANRSEAWYYIRVQQADGQIAWSSPIWIRP